MNACEVVTSLAALSQLPFLVSDSHEERVIRAYSTETRAVFTARKRWLQDELGHLLPAIGHAFDPTGPLINGDELVQRVWPVLTRSSNDRDEKTTGRPSLDGETTCVLDLGEDVLIDQQGLGAALNTLLDRTSFAGTEEKGPWFEDLTREWLLSHVPDLTRVSEMETELVRKRRVVGEADVVVRLGDTVFVIECKSRRARRVDTCVTYQEARSTLQPFSDWADQARRTAREFARRPTGAGPEIPLGVHWLVPLVCTPHIDLIPPLRETTLGPGISILMTPANAASFIHARQWSTDRSAIEQYRVEW